MLPQGDACQVNLGGLPKQNDPFGLPSHARMTEFEEAVVKLAHGMKASTPCLGNLLNGQIPEIRLRD